MNPLLKVEDLHITFHSSSKNLQAVRGVSFELHPGETLGIVGESGSGKTVMAKSLTKLIPKNKVTIEQGSVIYKNENLLNKTEKELQKIRGKEISMIFQDSMSSLNPTMKIGKQIAEGYLTHFPKAGKQTAYKKALDLLTKVGIPDTERRFSQYPYEFSGGMRQRVMTALAIISSPHILIADEPTTALDVTTQAQILRLIKEFQKNENMSVILITHDLRIVAGFCDRILVMYAGEIIESGSVSQIFNSPKHPYTKKLLYSIPRLDINEKKPLNTIQGFPPEFGSIIQGCGFYSRCPKAMNICKKITPPSLEISPDHQVKCWLYDSTLEMMP